MIITEIWKRQPGKYFCLSTKKNRKGWKDHFFTPDEFDQVPQFIRDHRDCDVYFCPHGLSRRSREKESAVLPNLLWFDLDEADPRTMKIRPTVAIESSPGRFVGLWVLDQQMTESVNRRLSYAVGGDKNGWDLGQVLRVPGTLNHKYADKPKVTTLWSGDGVWKLRELKTMLPADAKVEEYEESDSSEVFKKYERKMPGWLRRLLNAREARGDRSEILWKVQAGCLECGMTRDEAFSVIWGSVWNKYADRRNGKDRLMQDLEKQTNKRHQGTGVVGEKDSEDMHAPVAADSITPKNTDWMHYPWIPKNAITIVGAKGGTGKGLFCSDIVARLTSGKPWPMSREKHEPGNVLWGEAEDKLDETVLPRLKAAGADLSRIFFTKPSSFAEFDVREYIQKNNIKLIVLSPLMSFLEGLEDANIGIESRRAMEYLDRIIEGTGAAILAVMHVNKKPDLSATERILGSVEFANYCRSLVFLSRDDDGLVRVIHGKHNLSVKAEDLIFVSVNRRQKDSPRGQYIGIDWDKPEEDVESEKAFDRKSGDKDAAKERDGATRWLFSFLEGGAREKGEIVRAAEKASISYATLRRARQRSMKTSRQVRERTGRDGTLWFVVSSH